MNHIIVRLGLDALEACMHSITNMAEAQLEIAAAKNLSEIQIQQMDKELQLLQKYSTPIPNSPSILLKKNFKDISNAHELGISKEAKDHRKYWNKLFNQILVLQDHAQSDEVQRTLRQVKHDILTYKCRECVTHSKGVIFPTMESQGDEFTDAQTKNEAILKLSKFKNFVNIKLEKPLFQPESLIE